MPREGGEKMVVHLILQATAEPVYERVGGDIAGGTHLQFPEIGALICRIYSHAVVSQAEHDGEKEAAHGLCHEEVRDGIERSHIVHNPPKKGVVPNQGKLL